jgi:hypothetical protein
MSFFAVKGNNHETYGFDHRLCEWKGLQETEPKKFKAVKLEGADALNALLEAKGNPVLDAKINPDGTFVMETLGTGAVAMAPMSCLTPPPKKSTANPLYALSIEPKFNMPQQVQGKAKEARAVDPKTGTITAGLSDTVREEEKAPANPITGEVNDPNKEVISDDDKPGGSEKPKKDKAKVNDWLAKQPWHKGNKETEGTTDEAALPAGSKKSSALRRPKMASPKGPTHIGESVTPDDIANMITEDPDILA